MDANDDFKSKATHLNYIARIQFLDKNTQTGKCVLDAP